MRAFRFMGILLTGALGACGSVDDRSSCSASADCPAGQYCAHTADGNVCWADAVPPTVSNVTVWCAFGAAGGACLRDGVLRVTATVTDDHEVLGAEVALDVGGAPVQLVRDAAGAFTGDIQLASVPFDHFEHAVVVTVTARDGARNTTLEPAAAGTVTRHRFVRAVDSGVVGLGHPAVMADGTVAVAGTNAKVYFVPWDGSAATTSTSVGTLQITAAPLALGTSLWVGSEDNRAYEVAFNSGTLAVTARTDDTGGRILGSLALSADDRTLAATESGFVYAATSSAYRSGANVLPFALGPVVQDASIFAVSGGALKRLTLAVGAAGPDSSYSCQFGFGVTHPIAISAGIIAAVSNGVDGLLRRCPTAGGDPEQLASTGVPSGGPAVAADASILVPEQTKTVSRWTSAGDAFPGWQKPDLGGATRTPLVTTAATSPFIVPTAKGAIHALRGDGTVAWSAQLSAGTASLQPGNIYTPPGQITGKELSTAYFAGSDGVLHAVIVDGRLDGSAPWPKAFHDPRNTNRAGAQP